VDNNSDRRFLAIVKRQFRNLKWRTDNHSEQPIVGKVVFRNSGAEAMLQLVDMACGAKAALISNGDRTWYDLISERDVESQPSA
jgi:hypothetical protein